jgi:antitoxin component of MazEF toxin-antitoxin module
MIHGTQKIIKIGSSNGITIPTQDLKRENAKAGDVLEFSARVVRKASPDDAEVIAAAKKILKDYKQDFKNLAQR